MMNAPPLIFIFFLINKSSESTLYIKEGKNVVISWTLNPLPDSSSPIITVKNGADQNLFTVFYFTNVPSYTDAVGNRITYNGTIATGQMSFVLQNVQISDKGTYKAIVLEKTSTGPTLAIIAKPSKPNIQHTTVPVVGLSLTLRCSANSNSAPSSENFTMNYTWNVPSYIAYGASGSTITVTTIALSYNGSSITCTAQDSGGTPVIYSNISDSSVPYVIYPLYGPNTPSLDRSSQVTVEQGRQVPSITCTADCNPGCSYTWTKRGQGTVVTQNGVLSLGNAERSEDGTYYCTARNTYSTQNSADIEIDVQYGPNTPSLNRSSPVTVEQGRQVPSITCTADCNPGCSYTWTKRGQGTVTSQNGVLSLGNADRSEDGTYYCTARNTYGTQNSADIDIDVQYGPGEIIMTPVNRLYTILENTTISDIRCSADCNPSCIYKWNGANTDILRLGKVTREKAGTYVCNASNTIGYMTDTVTVIVNYPPHITNLSRSGGDQIMEGDTVMIECTVDSNPQAAITWSYRHKSSMVSVLETTPANRNELNFIKVKCTQTGTYICNADNGIQSFDRKELLFQIYCAPQLDQRTGQNKETKVSLKEENLNISVNFIAYPVGNVTWLFARSDFPNVTLQNGIHNVLISTVSELNIVRSHLQVIGLSDEQFGDYIAIIQNTLGQETAKFIVTSLFRKPDMPHSLSVKCRSHTTAVIKWTPGSDGGNKQSFAIEYSTRDGITTVIIKSSVKDEQTFVSDTVSGLAQNTVYFFKVKAMNDYGTTSSTEVVNCTTLELPEVSSAGTIAGAVVGSIVVISAVIAVGVTFYFCRKRQLSTGKDVRMKETRLETEYEGLGRRRNDENTYEGINGDGTVNPVADKSDLAYEELKNREETVDYSNLNAGTNEKALEDSRKVKVKESATYANLPNSDVLDRKKSEKIYENTVMK